MTVCRNCTLEPFSVYIENRKLKLYVCLLVCGLADFFYYFLFFFIGWVAQHNLITDFEAFSDDRQIFGRLRNIKNIRINRECNYMCTSRLTWCSYELIRLLKLRWEINKRWNRGWKTSCVLCRLFYLENTEHDSDNSWALPVANNIPRVCLVNTTTHQPTMCALKRK